VIQYIGGTITLNKTALDYTRKHNMKWEQLHPLVVEHLKETRWNQLEIRALVDAAIKQCMQNALDFHFKQEK